MRVGDSVLGVLSAVLGLLVLWQAGTFPEMPGHYFGPALFPSVIAWGFVAAGVMLLVRAARRKQLLAGWLTMGEKPVSAHGVLGAAIMMAAILAFVFLGEVVGFQLLTLATLIALYVWAGRRPLEIIVLPVILTVAFELLFSKLLRVPLPGGWLTDYLW